MSDLPETQNDDKVRLFAFGAVDRILFERQVGVLACQGFEVGGKVKLEPCKKVNRGARFSDLPMSRYRLFRYGKRPSNLGLG